MSETALPAFGQRLSALRQERGFTQEELAKVSGISKAAIGRWEMGANLPGAESVCKLADALNCSADVLLCRIDIATAHR